MKVDSFNITASSQRTYMSIQSTTMLAKKTAAAPPAAEKQADGEENANLSLSDAAKEMQEKSQEEISNQLAKMKATPAAQVLGKYKVPKNVEQLKLSLLEMMLEKLTGRKMKFRLFEPSESTGQNNGFSLDGIQGMSGGESRPQTVDSWEVESFSYEAESVSYQAQGVVKTADGKTINLDINMYMSREFASYTSFNIQSERPVCDPLVINYGGNSASLTGESFDFDLTMDGVAEKISMLGEGSGFLALDKNSDGKINDGSELFGPTTGSGFDELRKYDGDGNSWIDENDDIFSKLTVWSKDKNGNDQIFTLKELGIGAIYLGDVDTEFSFKNDSNQTTGVMRSTSFFLTEDGGAGTISHIDMAI